MNHRRSNHNMRASRGSGAGRQGQHFERSHVYPQNFAPMPSYSGSHRQQPQSNHSANYHTPSHHEPHHNQHQNHHSGYQEQHRSFQSPAYNQPQPFPPVVTPRRDNNNDCFHQFQQFEAVLNANSMNSINSYNQMRAYYNHGVELIPEIELPNRVVFTMNIHGNEFRHLIVQLPHFGNEISQRMPDIHQRTGCQISLSDRLVGKESEQNKITFTGPLETIEAASVEFLNLLPLHIGLHLTDLKDEFKTVDLRSKLIEWMEAKEFDYPTISFHFVKDPHLKDMGSYKYVVLRETRSNADRFIQAAYAFSMLALKKPLITEFSAGYRLPHNDRVWFLGSPEGSLVKAICDEAGTTIKYSNVNSSANSLDYSVFGSPKALIHADGLLRRISQATLQFDVDDEDLLEPHLCHPSITNRFIDETSVLVSYGQSLYQGVLLTGPNKIRHSITIRTSYENRRMLYQTRRLLLKPHLTENLPLNEIEQNHEEPIFGQHLRQILKALSHEH